ncbi:electron transfer flavoprotein subunit beta/FixA family protein [Alkalihalobacillus trypoxylicola]|uniref:Electron transfer flavoprotein subunit beta n=1 Tax=Alkalihalobacillus trypoxylicola TaxID=519424 RepID=A0A161PGA7_9BACI|nr:electron transfer flavoprotein subunit beta/FixA family protein [Alkalihalobacillus trypoxylicola]KYG32237.1 electron transfer flavoprotein subunit beta [Alkalihalobacillus trypoxylicola]
MRIYVLLKQTLDTEESLEIEDNKIVVDEGEKMINPYDEYAIEEALLQRDKHGGEVTAVSVGMEEIEVESSLRTAYAMGVDHAVWIQIEELAESDPHSTATILAAYLADKKADLIIGGNVSVDSGTGQVGPRLAEQLGINQATTILKLTIEDQAATVTRDVEGDEVVMKLPLPLLVTAQQGLNEPRYPSLPGIMKAKRKTIEELTLDDLSLDLQDVKAKTDTVKQYLPEQKEKGKQLEGTIHEQVQELVELLKTSVSQS